MHRPSLVLFFFLSLTGLAHAQAAKTPSNATSETENPAAKTGTGAIKEGATEVGQGVSDIVNSSALEAKSVICPVVADSKTKVYYAKDFKGYYEILKFAAPDKDEGIICFRSEAAARERGYKPHGS